MAEKIEINLDDTQIMKIAEVMQSTLESKLTDMVTTIVSKVLGDIDVKMSALQHENVSLKDKVVLLERRVEQLEKLNDISNQYSRRNCLRVSGIKEEPGESMDDIFKRLATEMKIDVHLHDIDNMHRLGKPKASTETSSPGHPSISKKQLSSRPRDIIVKFTSYRARQVVLTHRSELKHSANFDRVFINEELTKARGEVFYHARRLVKSSRVQSAWTSNGVILVKDISNKVHRCESMGDLSKFK